MDLLTFLRVIVLVTNGIYCFVPRGDFQASDTKTIPLPLRQQQEQRLHSEQQQQQQQQNVPANDISVYDPGVGKAIQLNEYQLNIYEQFTSGPTEDYFQLGSKEITFFFCRTVLCALRSLNTLTSCYFGATFVNCV